MVSPRSTSEQLVQWLSEIHDEGSSRRATDAVRSVALHVFGGTVLGAKLPFATATADFATRYEPGSCTVVGRREGATAAAAALANATAGHEDFREDTHSGSQSHPALVVLAAALAAAETVGAERPVPFARAVIDGVEVVGRIGAVAASGSTARGFRPSSLYPVFGAAVAAARVLGLDDEQLVTSLAFAAQSASGLNQPFFDETDDWFLSPGMAARSGVTAALLALQGIKAAPRTLEGEGGFFAAYGDVAGAVLDLTKPNRLGWYEVEKLRLKKALTCGWNQSLVRILEQMPNVVGAAVSSVRITMSSTAGHYPGVAAQGPFQSRSSALLSAPFAAAGILRDGRLTPAMYEEPNDPTLRGLASVVSVDVDPSYRGYTTSVAVTLQSGVVHVGQHLDDEPADWLTSFDDVHKNVHTMFEDAGIDPSRADSLATAVGTAVDTGDLRGIAEVLAR